MNRLHTKVGTCPICKQEAELVIDSVPCILCGELLKVEGWAGDSMVQIYHRFNKRCLSPLYGAVRYSDYVAMSRDEYLARGIEDEKTRIFLSVWNLSVLHAVLNGIINDMDLAEEYPSIPVRVNISFNAHGLPIVDTHHDYIEMADQGRSGQFFIQKHKWDNITKGVTK